MKILCPTDFSPRARAAAQVAVALARRTRGSIELLHVVPPRTTNIVALASDASVFEDGIRREAQSRLVAEARELAADGVVLTSSLAEGDVESAVLSRAKTISADLIVMGAHGRPAFERFILGSAAERTVRRADRPVLIVPPGVELPLPGARGDGRLRLVVALDGGPAGRGALEFVRSLRSWIPCDVTFLRFYWAPEEYARLGLTGPRDLSKPDPEITADLRRALAMQVGVLPGAGHASFAIEETWGDPASAILEFARGGPFDLVVMGAERRRGLSCIAQTPVARHVASQAAGVPVVFAPAPAAPRGAAEIPGVFTVLAPTDFSPEGNRAVGFAYALLAGHGGVVELCHVHERALPSPAYVYDSPEGKLSDVERARLVAALRALVPAEAQRLGITTHVTVIDGGQAARAILQAAERLVVDSIVLGSTGKGRASRALLGSISEEVVRQSHRPVLVVPRSKEES
jgi:nucleotide-binding universal stress UspA family protein